MDKQYKVALLAAFCCLTFHLSHAQSWQVLYDSTDHCWGKDWEKCVLLLEEALIAAEQEFGKEDSSYAITLNDLGICYYSSQKDLGKAEKLYLEAIDIFKKWQHSSLSSALSNLGQLYQDLGQFEEAETYLKEALRVAKAEGVEKNPVYATLLNNTALLYVYMGQYVQAEQLYQKSHNLRKELKGATHPDLAISYNNQAFLFKKMGRLEQAELYYKQALEIVKASYGEKHPYYASSLNNLAGVYRATARYQEAEQFYRQSLDIRQALYGEKHMDYAASLHNLAGIYDDMGQHAQVELLYTESLTILKELFGEQHPKYAEALTNLGLFYDKLGQYERAEQLYLQALEIKKETLDEHHPDYTKVLSILGDFYTARKDYARAASFNSRALDNYMYQISSVFPVLSEQEKEQFYLTAKSDFEKFNSFALLRSMEDPAVLSDMYDHQLATKALLLKATRKVKSNILHSGNSALIEQYKHWRMQKTKLSNIYKYTKKEVLEQEVNLDSLQELTHRLEKELSSASAIFAQTYDNRSYGWRDIQRVLNKEEAAVEIIRFRKFDFVSERKFTDSVYYAALVVRHETQHHPVLILLKNGNALEGRFLKAYQANILNQREKAGSYAHFWEPLKQELQGIKKIYLSPDGVYHQINVNTLFNPETNQYLLEETDIRLLTSTKDLLALQRETNPETAILFGFPNYALNQEKRKGMIQSIGPANFPTHHYVLDREQRNTLSPLPHTREEVENIDSLLSDQQWETAVFLSNDALEEKLKAVNKPKVLHIATHGYFDTDVEASLEAPFQNPLLRSGLMLAGAAYSLQNQSLSAPLLEDPVEDGILTAYEAVDLHLDNTDLVVLSACDTGLGEIKNGEGVYGLQRAFKVAGAKSLMMSLWKVNDYTTQELMVSFYQHWLQIGDIHEAFRIAQLDMKNKYHAPYFWGAFIIVGE